MKPNLYKHIALSLFFISIWILYGFLDHLIDEHGMFHGLGAYIYFIESVVAVGVLSITLALARVTYFRKARKHKIVNSFLYLFSAIFNMYIIVAFVLYQIISNKYFTEFVWLTVLIDFILGALFLADIFVPRKK